MKFREITAADVPSLFHVRTRTRENTMTLEELQRLGINPQSVTESLGKSVRGWVCDDSGRVAGFSMADRATGEFLVIAVLPEYEGKGVGGRLMALAEEWLAKSGCRRAWLTTDLDTALRAYGFYRKRGWTDWKIEGGLRWMELSLPSRQRATGASAPEGIAGRVRSRHGHRVPPLDSIEGPHVGTGDQLTVEAFQAGHAKELIPMWRESFEFGVGIEDPHPIAEQERYFRAVVEPNNAIGVAFLEGRMVGFVAASATSISQLYVRKGFHRRGIGSRLLDWAKGRSSGSLWLCTFERNAGARAFYERHGFRIVARGFEPFWKLDDLRYEWRSGAAARHRERRDGNHSPRRSDMATIARNTICLWYDGAAEEAARFYAATFPDSSVDAVYRAPGDFPSGKEGDVLTVLFTVMGIPCLGLNGGPAFRHSEAFSFQVATADQAETDRFWNAIVGNGGQESACGWCKDKWGVSWQITPRALTEAITDPDHAAARRAFDAMMTMRRIDIATIEAARKG